MLTTLRSVRGTWVVLDRDEPDPLGRVTDVVLHPANGGIEALWVKTPRGLRLLRPGDVHSWHENELRIESEADLATSDEVPVLDTIFDQEVPVIDARVWLGAAPSAQVIGRVRDFTFETSSPRLLSVVVRRGWGPWSREWVVPRQQIREINAIGVWVNDPESTIRVKSGMTDAAKILPEAKFEQNFTSDD